MMLNEKIRRENGTNHIKMGADMQKRYHYLFFFMKFAYK